MLPTHAKLDQCAVLHPTVMESRLGDLNSAEVKGQLGWAATINLWELTLEVLATDCGASRRSSLVKPVGVQTGSCVE